MHIAKITTIMGGLALLLLVPADVRANETMRRLMAGEILATSVTMGSGVKAGRAMAMINATPKQVYRVLSLVQHYREFVPNMTDSSKVSKGIFLLKSDLPWPAKDSWAKVKMSKGKRGGNYVLTWTMREGDFKRFEARAWVQAGGKGKSILTYQLLAVPRTIVPDKLLSKFMKSVTEDMTDAIRDRAMAVASVKVVAGQRVASQ